eukprot:1161579-Pelagomonas_calceolata.AAC.15
MMLKSFCVEASGCSSLCGVGCEGHQHAASAWHASRPHSRAPTPGFLAPPSPLPGTHASRVCFRARCPLDKQGMYTGASGRTFAFGSLPCPSCSFLPTLRCPPAPSYCLSLILDAQVRSLLPELGLLEAVAAVQGAGKRVAVATPRVLTPNVVPLLLLPMQELWQAAAAVQGAGKRVVVATPHGLWEAVAAVKGAGKRVIVATPRVLKPNEEPLVTFYLRLRADALLLRSAGLLYTLSGLGGPGRFETGWGEAYGLWHVLEVEVGRKQNLLGGPKEK